MLATLIYSVTKILFYEALTCSRTPEIIELIYFEKNLFAPFLATKIVLTA